MFGVAQHPRHDFSGRAVLEETDGKTLERPEHLHVQIMHNLLFKTVIKLDSGRSADIAQDIRAAETEKHDPEQLGLARLNDVIDHDLDEPWRHQFERRRQSGKNEGADDHRAMRT